MLGLLLRLLLLMALERLLGLLLWLLFLMAVKQLLELGDELAVGLIFKLML